MMTTEWRSRLRPASKVPADAVELGHFIGVFGIKGELRLHLDNRDSDFLALGKDVLLIDDQGRPFRARMKTRPGTNGRVLAVVAGIDTRELAADLVDVRVVVERSVLPSLTDGEYYLTDLIGMEVRCDTTPLGEVVAVHDHGPVDVIELDGGRYVPSTAEHIESIDLDARILYVVDGAVAV